VANIAESLQMIHSRTEQQLPIYSSHPVTNCEGLKQPLWWWKYHNRLDEITVPSFPRSLYRFDVKSVRQMTVRELCETAIERVDKVDRRNKFKQDEIISEWRNLFNNPDYQDNPEIPEITVEVEVSSGFYIRKLVEDIGELLQIPVITSEINRLEYF
jgi:hypothetical protein